MPNYTPTNVAMDFVAKKREWIAARLQSAPDAAPIAPGSEIAVEGEAHLIEWREDWPRSIRCGEGHAAAWRAGKLRLRRACCAG